MKRKIKRGDVFLCQISGAVGSEQDGTRPVVILQNNTGNQHSTTTIAAMITSQRKRELPVHVRLHSAGFRRTSYALLEQVRTISVDRLGRYICTLLLRQLNNWLFFLKIRQKNAVASFPDF